jgi:hypothetical protein
LVSRHTLPRCVGGDHKLVAGEIQSPQLATSSSLDSRKRQASSAVITCEHGELWRHSNTGQRTVAATGVAWRVEALKQTGPK